VNTTITAVDGLKAGHFTDRDKGTGCTVILAENGATGGVDVRGGSPGTRETDLLSPSRHIQKIHGIMLSGSSAYGLTTADGAMLYMQERGIGHRVGENLVPIIPAAILYDLNFKTNQTLSYQDGYSACQNASTEPLSSGSVGAGTGATVAKTNGRSSAQKGGIGSSSFVLPSGITVAATIAVNAFGCIYDHSTGLPVAIPKNAPSDYDPLNPTQYDNPDQQTATLNTTIGVIGTDASITKSEAQYLASIGHDGLALTIKPCHTMRDGDTLFAIGTGTKDVAFNIDELAITVVKVVSKAVLAAVDSL
tara:strand:+ start:5648 stop:6565 length:918 start_codon:yes stop_codon:yes gene_type:complete